MFPRQLYLPTLRYVEPEFVSASLYNIFMSTQCKSRSYCIADTVLQYSLT